METKRRWHLMIVAAAVLAAITLAACGGDDDDDGDDGEEPAAEVEQFPQNTTMGELQEEGEITIGVKFDVPPFGFLNPQTDEVEGFDVDLGRYIAERLGVEPVFREATSDNRIPLLVDGTIDLILSTMTITEERDQEVDFSEPYYIANGRVLVSEDSEIGGIEDLGSGDRVCTALGSTYAKTIRQEAPEADLRLIDRYSECLELIQTGAVDAISTDNVILTGMIVQDDTLKMVGEEITTEPYGVGIPEGDREFKEFVDQSVAAFIEDGSWEESYQEWVGQHIPEEDRQGPPEMTLEEALELFPL
jgi:glutamate transport system substrate-binding protein